MLDHSKQNHAPEELVKSPSVIKRLLSNPLLLLVALVASVGGFLFGYDEGAISSIQEMPAFKERFPMDSTEDGLVVSILQIGGLLGTYFIGTIADTISRKYSIMVALAIFLLGSSLQVSAPVVNQLIVGRFIAGIGIGSLSVLGPLYQSELAPADLRGSIVAMYMISVSTGVAVSFWIDFATSHVVGDISWRLPLLIQIGFAVLMAVGVVFIPFSPRWLSHVGREEEAYRVLTRLRRGVNVDEEWKEIKVMTMFEHQIEESQLEEMDKPRDHAPGALNSLRRWSKKEFVRYASVLRQGMWRRVLLGCTLMFLQQFLGTAAIIYYAPSIINTVGVTNLDTKLIATGAIGIIKISGCFTAMLLVDKLGRRKLLLTGSTVIMLSMATIGTLQFLFGHSWPQHQAEGWLCVAMIYVYVYIFGTSYGPIPYIVGSELFPLRVKAKAMAITTSAHWLFTFIMGFIAPSILAKSPPAMFFMFAGFGVLSFLFVLFILPETKGKTAMEVDAMFGGGTADKDVILMKQTRDKVDQLLEKATVEYKA
ncbi:general substrate transporter [Gongronella butleri]|nr:general substrate transporter [Gongronella butleri]